MARRPLPSSPRLANLDVTDVPVIDGEKARWFFGFPPGDYRRNGSYVYFAASDTAIKIGETDSLRGRLIGLNYERARMTRPAGVDDGIARFIVVIADVKRAFERKLHELFASHRIAQEWFRHDEVTRAANDLALIARLNEVA